MSFLAFQSLRGKDNINVTYALMRSHTVSQSMLYVAVGILGTPCSLSSSFFVSMSVLLRKCLG